MATPVLTADQREVVRDLEEDGLPITLRVDRNPVSTAGVKGRDPALVIDIQAFGILRKSGRQLLVETGSASRSTRPALNTVLGIAEFEVMVAAGAIYDPADGSLLTPGPGWLLYLGSAAGHPDTDVATAHPVTRLEHTQYDGRDPQYHELVATR